MKEKGSDIVNVIDKEIEELRQFENLDKYREDCYFMPKEQSAEALKDYFAFVEDVRSFIEKGEFNFVNKTCPTSSLLSHEIRMLAIKYQERYFDQELELITSTLYQTKGNKPKPILPSLSLLMAYLSEQLQIRNPSSSEESLFDFYSKLPCQTNYSLSEPKRSIIRNYAIYGESREKRFDRVALELSFDRVVQSSNELLYFIMNELAKRYRIQLYYETKLISEASSTKVQPSARPTEKYLYKIGHYPYALFGRKQQDEVNLSILVHNGKGGWKHFYEICLHQDSFTELDKNLFVLPEHHDVNFHLDPPEDFSVVKNLMKYCIDGDVNSRDTINDGRTLENILRFKWGFYPRGNKVEPDLGIDVGDFYKIRGLLVLIHWLLMMAMMELTDPKMGNLNPILDAILLKDNVFNLDKQKLNISHSTHHYWCQKVIERINKETEKALEDEEVKDILRIKDPDDFKVKLVFHPIQHQLTLIPSKEEEVKF